MQHLHAHKMKVRRDQIKIISDPDDIRIGIIRRQNRIAIGAVALVAPTQRRFGRNCVAGRAARDGEAAHNHRPKNHNRAPPENADHSEWTFKPHWPFSGRVAGPTGDSDG